MSCERTFLTCFNDIDIDDSVSKVSSSNLSNSERATAYKPKLESPAWFMHAENDSFDVLRMQAAYLYREQRYKDASQIYGRLLQNDKHKVSFLLQLLEAKARCDIQLGHFEEAEKLCTRIEKLTQTADQQICLWNLILKFSQVTQN